jgi:processive 1,2-diacylglycerol beta-glucosyltransferase
MRTVEYNYVEHRRIPSSMQKILFLPLLQMASGHHQVADDLIRSVEKRAPEILCRKIEFLSYIDKWMEKLVTGIYMK